MTDCVLRKALLEDISILNQMIPESVRLLSAGYYTTEQIEGAIKDVFGIDSQLITDGTYYVAQVGEAIAGCGGWSKRRTLFGGDQMKAGEDNLLNPEVDAARIRAFFVHPDWARRGIGSQIMRRCEQDAREAGFKKMELASTLPGEPLYRAFGFEEEERYSVNLSNGEKLEIVRMRKVILIKE